MSELQIVRCCWNCFWYELHEKDECAHYYKRVQPNNLCVLWDDPMDY